MSLGQLVASARSGLCIFAAALIPCLSWAAVCVTSEGGIAGTGAPVQNGGIGGTGAPRPPEKGGIGGTGQQAEGGIGGTGIVGIVTGFASVCVNDLEVHYDGTTPVERNGLPAPTDQLALGQVLAIEATGRNGALHARRIAILEAVAGPVTRLDAGTGRLEVMGQTVQITGETRLVGLARLDELAVGLPLHVSGYRDGADQVIASRVEVERGMEGVSAIGFIKGSGGGQDMVGGVAVFLPTATPSPGSEVLVRGTWDGSHLHAASVQPDPTLPFLGRVHKVVLEGLVLEHRGAGHLRISGFGVRYSPAIGMADGDIGQAKPGQRVRVTGRLDTGRRLEAEHIQMLPAGMGVHGTTHDRGDAKPGGQAGGGSTRASIGTMAPPLALPQGRRPIIRPSRGMGK